MDKKAKKQNRIWAIIFAAVVLLGLGAWFYLSHRSTGEEKIAVVSINGEEAYRIDLSKVKEAYEIPVETEWGSNTILVEPGQISISEADCPDQVCVRMGKISEGGIPIVCMPHRLYIQIEGGDIDA